MKKLIVQIVALWALALVIPANAAVKYWDINGATAGAGGATPTGNWTSTSFWSTDSTGSSATTTFTTVTDSAVFSAGADATGAYTVTLGSAQTAGSVLVEEGTVTKAGSALTTQTIVVNNGATLSYNSSGGIVASAGGTLTLNGTGATFGYTAGGAGGTFLNANMGIVLNGGGTLTDAVGNPNVYSGVISGTGDLIKTGAGILAITTTSTYSGSTRVNNGTLRLRTGTPQIPNTDLIVTSPGGFDAATFNQTVQSVSGTGNLPTSGNGTLTIAGTASTTFSGVWSGSGRINVNKSGGTGTLTLDGVNTATGQFTVTAGTVTVNAGKALCGAVCDLFVNGGVLNLNNTAQTVENLTGTNGTINLGSGHVLTTDPIASGTNASTIAGAGGLRVLNANATTRTLTLKGNSTYNGVTTVTKGILSVGSATALGSTVGNTVVGSGGGEILFTSAGANFTCAEPFNIAGVGSTDNGAIAITASAAPTLSGTITLSADSTVTISSSASGTFSGTPSFSGTSQTLTLAGGANATGVKEITGAINLDTGGLTKTQGGTWILSGANTYSGATTVSAGTLRVNSPGTIASSATTVAAAGTFGGTGTAGTVTVNGTIAPGASIGTLNTGDETWNNGSTNQFEINNVTVAEGVNQDFLNITGTLNLNGTITINVVGPITGFDNTQDYTGANGWRIATASAGISGSPTFEVTTTGVGSLGAGWFRVIQTANDLRLEFIQSPVITVDPVATQTVATGANVSMSATVTGSEPITYSWTKDNVAVVNGGNISGADTATLTLTNVVTGDSGSYVLTVTNAVGGDVSTASQLNVLDLPTISVQPVGATNSPGATFNPTVTATGGGTLAYQWKKDNVNLSNGGNISGATSSSLAVSAITALDAGNYTVAISNEVGDVTSGIAALAIQAAPTTNTYILARTDLATGKPEFSEPHGTGTNAFAYDWDSATPDVSAGAPTGFGYASFSANVSQSGATEPDRYRTLRIGFRSLFGRNVTLADVAKITYQTKKETAQTAVDWRLTIYTTHEGNPGDVASWYRSRLQAYPNAALSLNAPASQWNVWSTEAGDNQLQFLDNRAGFGTQDMLFSEITAGPVTRGDTHDYSGEEVMMVDIGLGANNSGGDAFSQLDAVVIRLTDGSEAILDLEEPLATPVLTSITPSVAATGGPGFTLTVNGSDFIATSVVRWNGADRVTTFINSGQLTATILAGDLASIGSVPVTVTTPGGGTSGALTFDVLDPANITVDPVAVQTVASGANVVISATVTGSAPITYSWTKDNVAVVNGGNVSGADTATLTLTNVVAGDSGSYVLTVTNAVGGDVSTASQLNVLDPANITVDPVAVQTVASGANVVISATVTGSAPITYSWTKDNVAVVNGGNVSGADTATLTLTNVVAGDSGSYVLTVTNAVGGDVSTASQLNVMDAPTISVQPVGATRWGGETFTPSVSAAGGGTLTYQWKKNDVNLTNGGNISGATSAALTVSAITALDAGNYTVAISNEVGDVTSSIAALAIQAATTNTYVLARTNLATGKPEFSPPHGTGTNAFGYDWDSATPDIGAGAPTGFGCASFSANVSQSGATEPDRYRTLRIGLRTLFGHNVALSQMAKISYQTKKETAQTAVDWRLTIYTTKEESNPGNNGSFYRSRLQAYPTLVANLNAPAGQWNAWSTETGDNRFQFEDNRVGFGVEDMAFSEITSGPVTRGANTHDYTAEEVMMIDITLGANNGGGDAISQLDAVVIRLADGSEATLDLEEPLAPPPLSILLQSPNVVISWESCATYILEETTELGSPTVWTTSPAVITTIDNTHSITVPETSAPMFYRLHLPE